MRQPQLGGAGSGVYRPRIPRASPPWQCARRHASELREAGRLRRPIEQQVIERFLETEAASAQHDLDFTGGFLLAELLDKQKAT